MMTEQQQMDFFMKQVKKGRPDISEEELKKIANWFGNVLNNMFAINLVVTGKVNIIWDDATNLPEFGVEKNSEMGQAIKEKLDEKEIDPSVLN